MSISRQNLSVIIVTLRSEKVIDRCIKSIDKNLPIIIVENSDNIKFKNYLESEYSNVRCILSKDNIGMGAGNNIGIKHSKTDYVYVLNPDTVLEPNTLEEIYIASKKLKDFSILSPISTQSNFPNYGKTKVKNFIKPNDAFPFKVDYVDGFSMLINKSKFKANHFFDENFFMYLENNDLCNRVLNNGGSIYIIPKSKINHFGGKAVDVKFSNEVELSRNWHWMWSTFYYNKKNKNFYLALVLILPKLFSSFIKCIFYLSVSNKKKKTIYCFRLNGIVNSILGKKSWYRPSLD